MDNELTCCICLEFFDNPVLLPCSHNFCKKCVRGLIQYGGGMRKYFNCPKCRHQVQLEAFKGIECLTLNKTLDNIVKLYRNQGSPSSDESDTKTCQGHGEPVIYYCHTCRQFLCVRCRDSGHSGFGHVVKNTDEFIQEEKDKIASCIKDLENIHSELKSRINFIEHAVKDVKQEEYAALRSVDQQFQQTVTALLCRKQNFVLHLEREVHRTIRPLQFLLGRHQTLDSKVMSLISEYDMVCKEKDKQRQLLKLKGFYVRLSTFLTFHLSSLEPLPKNMTLPAWTLKNLDQVHSAIENVNWVDTEQDENADTFDGKDMLRQNPLHAGKFKSSTLSNSLASLQIDTVARDPKEAKQCLKISSEQGSPEGAVGFTGSLPNLSHPGSPLVKEFPSQSSSRVSSSEANHAVGVVQEHFWYRHERAAEEPFFSVPSVTTITTTSAKPKHFETSTTTCKTPVQRLSSTLGHSQSEPAVPPSNGEHTDGEVESGDGHGATPSLEPLVTTSATTGTTDMVSSSTSICPSAAASSAANHAATVFAGRTLNFNFNITSAGLGQGSQFTRAKHRSSISAGQRAKKHCLKQGRR